MYYTQVLYIHVYTYMYVHVVYRYHMCVHMHVPRYDVMYVLVYVCTVVYMYKIKKYFLIHDTLSLNCGFFLHHSI